MDALVAPLYLKRRGYRQCRIPGEPAVLAGIDQLIIQIYIGCHNARLVQAVGSRPDDLAPRLIRLDFKLRGGHHGFFRDRHIRRAVGIRHPECGGAFDAFLLGEEPLDVFGVSALRLVKPGILSYTLDAALPVDAVDDLRNAGDLACCLSSGKAQDIHRVKCRVSRNIRLKRRISRGSQVIDNALQDIAPEGCGRYLHKRIRADVIDQAVIRFHMVILGESPRPVGGVKPGVLCDVVRNFG